MFSARRDGRRVSRAPSFGRWTARPITGGVTRGPVRGRTHPAVLTQSNHPNRPHGDSLAQGLDGRD